MGGGGIERYSSGIRKELLFFFVFFVLFFLFFFFQAEDGIRDTEL